MSDLISRADVLEGLKHSTAYLHDDIYTIVNRIPSAETTGALDEAITKYVTDGYMLPPSTLTALPSADAEQVAGKLNKRDDSLLTADTETCKEQKSKLDLISRQDAIEAIERKAYRHTYLDQIISIIDSLPSAEPKTGKWIEVEVFPEVYDIEGVKTWGSEMQCDQCGFRFTAIEGHIRQYNYCPNCGSYNGGEEE